MDVSVKGPGDLPMVPALPEIVVRLEGYRVTLNDAITVTQGRSVSKGTTWDASTTATHSRTREDNWEVGVEAEVGFEFPGVKASVKAHANYGGSIANTHETSNATSRGGSLVSTEEWSQATTTNPTEAAKIKLFLKVHNQGSACASNVVPTLTLRIGGHNVATFQPGENQVNLLEPGGTYPSTPGRLLGGGQQPGRQRHLPDPERAPGSGMRRAGQYHHDPDGRGRHAPEPHHRGLRAHGGLERVPGPLQGRQREPLFRPGQRQLRPQPGLCGRPAHGPGSDAGGRLPMGRGWLCAPGPGLHLPGHGRAEPRDEAGRLGHLPGWGHLRGEWPGEGAAAPRGLQPLRPPPEPKLRHRRQGPAGRGGWHRRGRSPRLRTGDLLRLLRQRHRQCERRRGGLQRRGEGRVHRPGRQGPAHGSGPRGIGLLRLPPPGGCHLLPRWLCVQGHGKDPGHQCQRGCRRADPHRDLRHTRTRGTHHRMGRHRRQRPDQALPGGQGDRGPERPPRLDQALPEQRQLRGRQTRPGRRCLPAAGCLDVQPRRGNEPRHGDVEHHDVDSPHPERTLQRVAGEVRHPAPLQRGPEGPEFLLRVVLGR
ncbi:MAG: hypothetical protein IPN91_12690 [Holophagaceae bacterium]|uniref:Protective antigen heptamerisation domain-containing protein n=1 Tax=Candidatus Geothrix odensensis TaxID=2954440 RepID=A0A936F3M1_9BACT|nr:hypothetical protein [Candidatus Geothrix odensensis]